MNLLNNPNKAGQNLGLLYKTADIEDSSYLSKFFVLTEFNTIFTAGKNSVSFAGSSFLNESKQILIECYDSNNQSLYIELANSNNKIYKESTTQVASIHVYNDTYNGIGKLVFYGYTKKGLSVKWTSNILIDKTKKNVSTVRFYKKPTLEINPFQSPLLSDTFELVKTIEISSSFYGKSVVPESKTSKDNIKNIDIDYRIIANSLNTSTDSGSFNFQNEGFPITLRTIDVQSPINNKPTRNISEFQTSVKEVVNNKTLKISEPYFFSDKNNKDLTTDILSGSFYIKYPYVVYNTSSTKYLTIKDTNNADQILKQSYAEIIYRDIKTFSGYIARHKIYRKSLFSTGEFEIIADEPLSSQELLSDSLTLNRFYSSIGKFYNKFHIEKYWFSSSNNFYFNHNSDVKLNSMDIKTISGYYGDFTNQYIIAKNDSVSSNRDAGYVPFNQNEYALNSGSSYDSNFIELKKDVIYIFSVDVISVGKNPVNDKSDVSFYFTSSLEGAKTDINFNPLLGVKLAKIDFHESFSSKSILKTYTFFVTVSSDLYGTVVIRPNKCAISLANISLKPYGDDGFSPDILVTKIPFPIRTPNETFEIKSELFDLNSNLVYSDLKTIKSFDPSGSTLNLYMPGYSPNSGDIKALNLYVNENLFVSASNFNLINLPIVTTPDYYLCLGLDGRVCKKKYP